MGLSKAMDRACGHAPAGTDVSPQGSVGHHFGWLQLATSAPAVTLPRVIDISCTQVEVHVFRRRAKRLEMLLLRRSPQRSLAGVWQPVTGGIDHGESAMAAAAREVLEETGLTPIRWWALEQPASFYDVAHDRIRVVPVFAAEVAWTDSVQLSDEHDRYEFLPLATASKRVLWATQRQAHAALAAEVLSGSPGGAAREITARIAALAVPRPRLGAKPAARRSRVRTGASGGRNTARAATGGKRRATTLTKQQPAKKK
jgi:dATP pyrophosphohydrolase